jgi:hypothetical protein
MGYIAAAARLRAPDGAMVICTETASFDLSGLSLPRGTEGSYLSSSAGESHPVARGWRSYLGSDRASGVCTPMEIDTTPGRCCPPQKSNAPVVL